MTTSGPRPWQRKVFVALLLVALVFGLLSIPDTAPAPLPPGEDSVAFAWNADAMWHRLQNQFADARVQRPDRVAPRIQVLFETIRAEMQLLRDASAGPNDTRFEALQNDIFTLAAFVAAHPARAREFAELIADVRTQVKILSENWPSSNANTRRRLYRLLYGSRAALEEVLLQAGPNAVPELLPGVDVPSATPSAMVRGLRIHSGDVLMSRGNAATSALIARGNDYPGNFSHVALVHVDATTHRVSLIQAHLEVGVVVDTLETYLHDGKMRVLVLRPRADLPAILENPMLPHIAATHARDEALAGHIPYDFQMDYANHKSRFCSEVASAAYAPLGVPLWKDLSSLSSHANRFWLASFGVTHFQTDAPADLEYDPQLQVVAEWRQAQALLLDHRANAVVDAMLEEADRDEPIRFKWWRLPFARLAKAYSVVLNWFGKIGPVPEGMSATVALRAQSLANRHARIDTALARDVETYRAQHHYLPPYWEMVRMARNNASHIGW